MSSLFCCIKLIKIKRGGVIMSDYESESWYGDIIAAYEESRNEEEM